MVELCPIRESHADALFPFVFHSHLTDTLVWNGPDTVEQLREGFREREEKTRAGLQHVITILNDDDVPVGSIGLVPDEVNASGSIGLWVGQPFQGMGYGTAAVRVIVMLGFCKLLMERLEARVFVGNIASRRIFEKNGFMLEGTLRHVIRKREVLVDEWVLGMIREDYQL